MLVVAIAVSLAIVSFEFSGIFDTFYFLIILCCLPPRQLGMEKKKRFSVAKMAEWDLSSKLKESNSLWAAVFATHKQDKTNVDIVACGCCNQGFCGALHSQIGETSLLGASFLGSAGYIWLREMFLVCVENLMQITRCQCPFLWPGFNSHALSASCPHLCSLSCMPQSD